MDLGIGVSYGSVINCLISLSLGDFPPAIFRVSGSEKWQYITQTHHLP